jgi:integrase
VLAVADALPVRYRALALLATFAGLRWGELAGLRRENIDLEACEIRIVETTAEPDRGALQDPGQPGVRAFPCAVQARSCRGGLRADRPEGWRAPGALAATVH